MDFNDTPEEAAFRAEARGFLSANVERKSRARPVLQLGDLGSNGDRFARRGRRRRPMRASPPSPGRSGSAD